MPYYEKNNIIKGDVIMKKIKECLSNKKEAMKQKVDDKAQQCKMFIETHKEDIITIAPVVMVGASAAVKMTYQYVMKKQDQICKDLYVYDRSLGHYWRLRRKLRKDEWLYIEKRKQAGESLGSILADLKVLR